MCQVTRTSRTFSTSSIQREVIQANGHSGSNQKSACRSCSGVNDRDRSRDRFPPGRSASPGFHEPAPIG